jgi:CheY-like chemotaxis protein
MLTDARVLVIGPNPVFLRYISQVLPSLGETSATQTTVDGLLALLTDRVVRYGWDEILRGFGAMRVRASVSPGEGRRRWDEVVWEGKPGERSVFVICASATNHQEVYQVALNSKAGDSTLRYYVPYSVPGNPQPAPVVAYSLVLLRFHEDRGDLWNRYLSRSASLAEGLGAVIGINENPSFADWVYFVVEHPAKPTTFKAVVGWERRRSGDRSNFDGRKP